MYLLYFKQYATVRFAMGLLCRLVLFVVPPESRIPLETPPVSDIDVRGLHLRQGGASQRRPALHASVRLVKLRGSINVTSN